MDGQSFIIVASVFLFTALEHRFPYVIYGHHLYDRTHTNLLFGLVNISINHLTIAPALGWIFTQDNLHGLLNFIPSVGLQFIFVFLLLDGYLYIWHRFMHAYRLSWRFHYIHHSQHQINTSTAYRFHPFEAIFSNIPKLIMVWFLGIQIQQLVAYELIFAIALMFQHCNWSIPHKIDRILSEIIITPNIHRTHHAKNINQANANFGSVLSIWDKLFHTWYYPTQLKNIEPEKSHFFGKLKFFQLLILPFTIRNRINLGKDQSQKS